jgi:hypothetical protein
VHALVNRRGTGGGDVWERRMRDLAAAADRIDYWIRRHVFQHYPSQSRLNPARDRRVGLSAIGQCLKDQYAAAATPIPRISLHSPKNSKRRNGDSPLGTPSGGPCIAMKLSGCLMPEILGLT